MSTSLRCPRGHRWDLSEDGTSEPGTPVACPFCGVLCSSGADVPPESSSLSASAVMPATRPAAGDAAGAPRVPGFEVLGELGRGGMGTVYRARQLKADRVVALKVPHAGAGLEDRVRFMTEARAVARLSHPNIVQVFEVGEAGGGPYMALEFCPGGSLADRLDGTPLPPRAATELVEAVARGVAAAHALGIVHRDLKPGNILLVSGGAVSGESPAPHPSPLTTHQPKVSDFGLARRLDLDDGPTRSGVVMGTPSYMAPEQARGDSKAVGPPADVYALGSVLYELLTGRPPFKGTTLLDTLDQACKVEPVPPARLQPGLPRDLETIALKCLRKEPEKRYPTAGELADDLRRFLDGRPILARPVGWAERLVKRARRHPLPAALLALLAVVVVVGVTWGVWKQFRLTAERDRARDHLRLSLRAIDELLTEVGEQDLAAEPRAEQTRRRLLEKALRFYEELLARESDDLTVRWELARATRRVGDIHRQLGSYPKALESYGTALARLERLRADGHDPPERRAEVAQCHNWRGEVYRLTERTADADVEYREAIAAYTALLAEQPGEPRHSLKVAQSLYNRGIVAGNTGRGADARERFWEALRVLEAVAGRTPEHRQHEARVWLNLAHSLLTDKQYREAVAASEQAVELLDALVAEFPDPPQYRHELGAALLNLAAARVELKEFGAADGAARPGRDLLEKLVADYPHTAAFRSDLAKMCTAQAGLAFSRDRAAAAAHTREAVRHWRALIAQEPGVAPYHGELGVALGNLGVIAAARAEEFRRYLGPLTPDGSVAARWHFTEGIAEVLTALRANPEKPHLRTALKRQTRALADQLVRAGEYEAALAQADEIRRGLPNHPEGILIAVRFLARCATTTRATPAAADYAGKALELIGTGKPTDLAPLLDDPDFDPFRSQPAFRAALGRP
jgi:tetratricopeptide (TPR) repeat protein